MAIITEAQIRENFSVTQLHQNPPGLNATGDQMRTGQCPVCGQREAETGNGTSPVLPLGYGRKWICRNCGTVWAARPLMKISFADLVGDGASDITDYSNYTRMKEVIEDGLYMYYMIWGDVDSYNTWSTDNSWTIDTNEITS